jgi:hypothetical protein
MGRPGLNSTNPAAADERVFNDLDVTRAVRVSSPEAVKTEVLSIYSLAFPSADTTALGRAFDLFAQLYQGRFPGYHPCDTLYHDIQHSLDITLTTARLLRGYQKVHDELSDDQFVLGVVTALFHDAGYIRRLDDTSGSNGAEYTSTHVSRSADFMLRHLPTIDLSRTAHRAAQIVHLTGYEVQPQHINPEIPADRLLGDFVATADLITQMADRCYLEKCRDRLFPELTLAACANPPNHSPAPLYQSAEELLLNTPDFYRLHVRKRLEHHFKSVFRYAAAYFNGANPYITGIENNIRYLETLIAADNLDGLRRHPPHNHGQRVFPYERLDALLKYGCPPKRASR